MAALLEGKWAESRVQCSLSLWAEWCWMVARLPDRETEVVVCSDV